MKKIMILFSIVAIVAMMGCPAQNEDVDPDKSYGDYKPGVYYKELGGYVLTNQTISGTIRIVNKENLGPYLSNEIPNKFSIEGFNDWKVPNLSEADEIGDQYDIADDLMGMTPGGWYWCNNGSNMQLYEMYQNQRTVSDDGKSHPLRVVRKVQYTPTEKLP